MVRKFTLEQCKEVPNKDGKKYGHRPNYEQRIDLNLKRVKGKQYKYIYPINKDDREYLVILQLNGL